MTNRLIHGDCLNVLLPPNYFDTLITDPPYGLGFMGKDWDLGVPGVRFWKKFLDACKPGAFAFVFGGTRTSHRLVCAIEDAGWEIRDCMMWLYGSGFPKSYNIAKGIDKLRGNEREAVRKRSGAMNNADNSQAQSFTKGNVGFKTHFIETKGTSEWEGYGTALKPAWEPIIVAMKPLDGTFAHNAEIWGVGGLWIDGGRIDAKGEKTGSNGAVGLKPERGWNTNNLPRNVCKEQSTTQGRWPANVILDEGAGAMLDEQSGTSKSTKSQRGKVEIFKKEKSWIGESTERGFTDSGGASRFFYCAKAGKKERGEDNAHPTVKPLALMEYLCKLSRPPQGGVVLDPFAGSGTTALACMNTDRQYTVIEKEREYCEIIAARLGGAPVEITTPQRPRLS